MGLAAAAIISLFWTMRPQTLINRIILIGMFGVALILVLLQYSGGDTDVLKHIFLLIALILLIQGVLIAAQTERVREKNG